MGGDELSWITWGIILLIPGYFFCLFCWWVANSLGFTEVHQSDGPDDSGRPIDFDSTDINEPMWHNEQSLPTPQQQHELPEETTTDSKEPLW